MITIVYLLLAWFIFGAGGVRAEEHPACRDLDYSYTDQTPSERRDIAASCRHAPVARLYYHRARHADLVAEERKLARLIPYQPRESHHHFGANNLYIALIEVLAPVWYPDPLERIEFLNAEYEYRCEVAELRLHGYDALADLLERKSAASR